jgi:hypothetical protein
MFCSRPGSHSFHIHTFCACVACFSFCSCSSEVWSQATCMSVVPNNVHELLAFAGLRQGSCQVSCAQSAVRHQDASHESELAGRVSQNHSAPPSLRLCMSIETVPWMWAPQSQERSLSAINSSFVSRLGAMSCLCPLETSSHLIGFCGIGHLAFVVTGQMRSHLLQEAYICTRLNISLCADAQINRCHG